MQAYPKFIKRGYSAVIHVPGCFEDFCQKLILEELGQSVEAQLEKHPFRVPHKEPQV